MTSGISWDRFRELARRSTGVLATIGSRFLTKALSLGFIVLLARLTSPETFAAYSYLIVLALSFYILTDTGVGVVAGRDVARGDLDVGTAYRASLLPVTIGNLVGAIAIVTFGLLDSGPGTEGLPLAFAAVYVVTAGYFGMQANLIRCTGRLKLEAVLQTISAVSFVVVGTVLLLAGFGLAAIMAAFGIRQVLLVLLAQRFLPLPWSATKVPGTSVKLLKRGLLIGVASTFLVIVGRSSLVLVANLTPVLEAARYSVAFRFLDLELMLAQTLGFALLPAMGARAGRDQEEGRRLARRFLFAFVGASLVVVPIAVLITPAVLVFCFGETYAAAAPAAQILVALTPVLLAFMLAWYGLMALKMEGLILASAAAALVASAGSALVIVNNPTSTAAALSAVVAFGVGAACCTTGLLLQRWRPSRSAQGELEAVAP